MISSSSSLYWFSMQYFLVRAKLNPIEKYYRISKQYMKILNDELH